MKLLIIANPAAGTITAEQVWELFARCRRHTGAVSVRWTTAPADATHIAIRAMESTVDIVIAVGGDGTAREVAAGLVGGWHGATTMLIVPAGTANSFYHTLWGATPWQSAVDVSLTAPAVRRLDMARTAGRLVLAGASAGFSARAIHEARALTDRAGPARYYHALVNLIPRYRPYPGRVLVDDQVVHSGATLLANVGGSRYRGGQFELLPHSAPDDGLLDVCVIGGEEPIDEMMRLVTAGEHLSSPGVVYGRGRRVRIERTDGQPLWFEHDGEVLPLATAEFTVDIVPGVVSMLSAAA